MCVCGVCMIAHCGISVVHRDENTLVNALRIVWWPTNGEAYLGATCVDEFRGSTITRRNTDLPHHSFVLHQQHQQSSRYPPHSHGTPLSFATRRTS